MSDRERSVAGSDDVTAIAQIWELLSYRFACRLRRLYHLFWRDPTTWEEVVAVEGVDEGAGVGVSSGHYVVPGPFLGPAVDWTCDWP